MFRFSRRRLLLGASAGILAGVSPALLSSREYSGEMPYRPTPFPSPRAYDPENRFLTDEEREFIEAAVDRLIPADDWPSASELGVVDFIDHQLAGPFGRGSIYYTKPPFLKGSEQQGYQSGEPAKLYRTAIAEIEERVAEQHGARFAELEPDQQDEILKQLEEGEMELGEASATDFFTMLLQNTKEGYFGDPVHGGNRNMESWRMIGFPGARYDYRPYVDWHNKRVVLEPVSVAGFTRFTPETRED